MTRHEYGQLATRARVSQAGWVTVSKPMNIKQSFIKWIQTIASFKSSCYTFYKVIEVVAQDALRKKQCPERTL